MYLSEIMWVEAGYGKNRKVLPFVLIGDNMFSLMDDKFHDIDSSKSMYDNLYEICQNEYNFPTVVMPNFEPGHLDTTTKNEPKILNVKLPKMFMLKHKKEYMDNLDITVSELEVKKLAKYIQSEKTRQMQENNMRSL